MSRHASISRVTIPSPRGGGVFLNSLLILTLLFMGPWGSGQAHGGQVPSGEAPLLLFQIEEGMEDGFFWLHRDEPEVLEAYLQNVHDALSELTGRYQVAVLFYPTHFYDSRAWGKANPRPLDTIHEGLRGVFDFFAERSEEAPVGVVLELCSSGIRTNQNGKLGSKAPPPLRFGDRDRRHGVSMDLDAVAALAQEYPGVFRGVRFHEIYGSDTVYRAGHEEGFLVDEEFILGAVDTCRDNGLILIWSDSGWLGNKPVWDVPKYVHRERNLPYIEREPYATLQDYAEEQLGQRLIFNIANNNYHFTPNLLFVSEKVGPSDPDALYPLPNWLHFDLPYDVHPLMTREKAQWGLSVQSWFWHELTSTVNGVYYLLGEVQSPPEILQAYTKFGLAHGAAVIQYEPDWYFFNNDPPYLNYAIGQVGHHSSLEEGLEERGAARLSLRLLKESLLAYPNGGQIPSDLDRVFDRNQQRFHENDHRNPPMMFSRTGLIAHAPGDGGSRTASFESHHWSTDWRATDHTPYSRILAGRSFLAATRVEVSGDALDELAILSQVADGVHLEIYAPWGGRAHESIIPVEGRLLGATAANLIVAPTYREGRDPDELILAVEDRESGRVGFHVYHLHSSVVDPYALEVRRADPEEEAAALGTRLAEGLKNSGHFHAIASTRPSKVMAADGRRERDALHLLLADDDSQLLLYTLFHRDERDTPIGLASSDLAGPPLLAGVDHEHSGAENLLAGFPTASGLDMRLFVQQAASPGEFEQAAREMIGGLDFTPAGLLSIRATIATRAKRIEAGVVAE